MFRVQVGRSVTSEFGLPYVSIRLATTRYGEVWLRLRSCSPCAYIELHAEYNRTFFFRWGHLMVAMVGRHLRTRIQCIGVNIIVFRVGHEGDRVYEPRRPEWLRAVRLGSLSPPSEGVLEGQHEAPEKQYERGKPPGEKGSKQEYNSLPTVQLGSLSAMIA